MLMISPLRIPTVFPMAEIKHDIHRTPRGSQELDMSSSAVRLQASSRNLIMIAVLICVLAVAAYLATHGWSDVARQLSHAFGHLPRPLQALLGGSRFAHLLAAAQ
jgi:hypothetical protein